MMKYDHYAVTTLCDSEIPDGEYDFVVDSVVPELYIDQYDQERCKYIVCFKVLVSGWIKDLPVTVYLSSDPGKMYYKIVNAIAQASHVQGFNIREDLIGTSGRLRVKNVSRNGKVYRSLDDIISITLPINEKFNNLNH